MIMSKEQNTMKGAKTMRNEKLEALLVAEEEMFYQMCRETNAEKKEQYRKADSMLKAMIKELAEQG